MGSQSEPLLSKSNTEAKGGLKTMPFIIANEAFERVASFGLQLNMILYLTREYNVKIARATDLIFIWSAASNFLPILRAIVADSYVGRYPMVAFGSITSLLGMFLLWLTTFPKAKPTPCAHVDDMSCESPTTLQLMLLCTSFVFMSIGAGGIRSSSAAFGVDQLDRGDDSLENASVWHTYFNWYGIAIVVPSIIAVTCVVYIQDHFGWMVGFGVPVVLIFLSASAFFLATPFYVMEMPKSILFSGLAQVVVASYKNRRINLSTDQTAPDDQLCHQTHDSMLLLPSDNLRDSQQDLTPDGKASNTWSQSMYN